MIKNKYISLSAPLNESSWLVMHLFFQTGKTCVIKTKNVKAICMINIILLYQHYSLNLTKSILAVTKNVKTSFHGCLLFYRKAHL